MDKEQLIKLKEKNDKLAWSQMIEGTAVNIAMPVQVTIETTLKCNMRCKMCQIYRNPELIKKANITNSDMSINLFKKITAELFPTAKIACPTVMGEPFLTSFFPDFVNTVADYGLKMNIVTNGMLLDEHISKSIMPYLFNLTISFDGANKKTFESIRRGAKFEKVIENITNFDKIRKEFHENEKPSLTLQVTLMRENIEELPEIVELGGNIGVDRIVAFHMYAFDDELQKNSLWNYKELTDKYLKQAKEIGNKYKIELTFPSPFQSQWDQNAFDSDVIAKASNGRRCKFLWSEVWVSHNGDITPCCVPNRPIMGNLNKNNFQEIWNGEMYQRMRKGLVENKPFECCQNCSFTSQYRGESKYREQDFFLQC